MNISNVKLLSVKIVPTITTYNSFYTCFYLWEITITFKASLYSVFRKKSTIIVNTSNKMPRYCSGGFLDEYELELKFLGDSKGKQAAF